MGSIVETNTCSLGSSYIMRLRITRYYVFRVIPLLVCFYFYLIRSYSRLKGISTSTPIGRLLARAKSIVIIHHLFPPILLLPGILLTPSDTVDVCIMYSPKRS